MKGVLPTFKYSISIILISFVLVQCTKQVPETERKSLRTDEAQLTKTVERWENFYNNGDLESLITLYTDDYIESSPEDVDITGVDNVRSELSQYMSQYPGGKWKLTIEEVQVSGDLGFARIKGEFEMPYGKFPATIYTERSLRILQRQRGNNWKFYRTMRLPTFTYDSTSGK